MKTVLAHYTQIEKYSVPNHIAKKSCGDIQEYITENGLEPFRQDGQDWEIVDVED